MYAAVRWYPGSSKLLDLKVRWASAGGTYESCGSQSALKVIPVFAWGVNRYEKVACPKDSMPVGEQVLFATCWTAIAYLVHFNCNASRLTNGLRKSFFTICP